ncbi:oligosaccharide flippase family protein, partial [Sphingobium sp.]|uniref:oligosaccharide flippase family protein n=1 Tax=Sphingobium sp. TaxID=1912891 RepID=UPI002C80602D
MALFAFAARSLQQASTLVITLLAAHFLLPAQYGIYSLGIVFVILIQTLTYTGFYQFILTSKEDDAAVLSTCFWLIVGLVSAASALLAIAAYPLEWLFEAEHLGGVLALLALIQPLASVGAWSSAALLRRRAITLNFAIMFTQNLVALVGGALLLWFWHSLYALVAFRYLRVISGAILFAIFGRDWPQMRFRKDLALAATAFSGGLYGSRMLGFLSRYAGDLLLGLLYSASAVGLYRFGNRVATGATDTLTQPMSSFAATQFGSAARQGTVLAAPLTRFAGTITLLTGMLGAVIVVFARDVIALFFQPSYMAALVVTYAMALRGVAGLGQLLVEPAFSAQGRTSWVMMFNLVTAAVSVLAVFCASPFGLEVLAWTQTLVVLCSTLWAFALIRWKARIDVSGAVRNFTAGLALSIGYGVVLHGLRLFVFPALP